MAAKGEMVHGLKIWVVSKNSGERTRVRSPEQICESAKIQV